MVKELIKKFIPSFLLDWYHRSLALLGALVYRFPSKSIKVIGVTGTNGKTTVINLTTRILEEAGYRVATLSSIRFKIGKTERENDLKMTMPGRLRLQKFLRGAVDAKCQYVVLEVTSEGIKQHRHRSIDFDTAVFTNLTPEHIESHGGFENYKKAKGKLFKATKNIHVINLDDENDNFFLQFPAKKKYGYAISNGRRETTTKQVKPERARATEKGIEFSLQGVEFKIPLLGMFNIYNALAAICVAMSQGINLETCKVALEKVEGIPGRMEKVISQPFKVFVDYAFTPNALEQVYKTLKTELPTEAKVKKRTESSSPSKKGNKMIAVLGSCGGGRDKWKRPVLGELAAKYCQKVIVTNEDPYDEDPMEIIEQVAKGAGGKAEKILGRREAINRALNLAQEGDVVVVTGKGCEPWIVEADNKKIPWDDRKIVKEEFAKLKHDF